ncbi:MAG: hypothetical protein LQ342_006587 [Letrouitia transgressa]|nr:MAG: hypothetical protein LQ342_006587 [Letrouitia transgressa]
MRLNGLFSYLLFILTSSLLSSARPETCDHKESRRINNPEDCVSLANMLKHRSGTNRIFKVIPHGTTPTPREVPLPYAEHYGSCAMGITIDHAHWAPGVEEDSSSWYTIGMELTNIYNYCDTAYWHLGGIGITGVGGKLMVGISRNPGLRISGTMGTNETEVTKWLEEMGMNQTVRLESSER